MLKTQTRGHPPVVTRYAAFSNQGFLLREVGLVASLLLTGASVQTVKTEVLEQDLFQLASPSSRQTLLTAVTSRLGGVDETLLGFLADGGLVLRRLTNLYLVLLRHRLLREFVAEVLQEELLRFRSELARAEVNSFFQRKRVQETVVGGWSPQTLAKSRSNIVTICADAGLLERVPPDRQIIVPQLVPQTLRASLKQAGREAFLPLLLSGER